MNFLNNIISVFTLVLILIISFSSCSTVDDIFGGDDDVVGEITLEKPEFKSGEVGTISTNFDISDGYHDGNIGNTSVQLNAINNTLYFVVPDIEAGMYELVVSIDQTDYDISITIFNNAVSNPEYYVDEVKSFYVGLFDNSIEIEKILVESDIIDSLQAIENRIALQSQLDKANEAFSEMTEDDKIEFARVYSANAVWINEFQQFFLSGLKSGQCETLLHSGNSAKNAGNVYEARDHFLKYKHCRIDNYNNASLVYYLNKFNTLIDDLTGENNKSTLAIPVVPVLLALGVVYLAFKKMEAEVKTLNSNPLADEFDEDKKSSSVFINNEKTNYSKRVRFRAVDQNDISREDIFGKFVGLIHDVNDALLRILSIIPDTDINPITLSGSNETVDFNRNFVIQNISNSDVSIESSNIVGDMWEVVLSTNKSEDQQFTYDLVYNDGKTQIIKEYSAMLTISDPLLGIWEAYEIDGVAVGEWQYYYLSDCQDLVGWANVTHSATLTFYETSLSFYYSSTDKVYQYTGLDYITCSYESLDIETSSDGDSETYSYTIEGNTIIAQTPDGPFPLTYQLTDQNNELIIVADGEVNKYRRAN